MEDALTTGGVAAGLVTILGWVVKAVIDRRARQHRADLERQERDESRTEAEAKASREQAALLGAVVGNTEAISRAVGNLQEELHGLRTEVTTAIATERTAREASQARLHQRVDEVREAVTDLRVSTAQLVRRSTPAGPAGEAHQ